MAIPAEAPEAPVAPQASGAPEVPLGEPITRTSTAAMSTNPQAAGFNTATVPCPGVRCITVTVTGDVLLHEPLWEQAAEDAGDSVGPEDAGAGAFDFRPLFAGQKPFVEPSDVAICHLETPVGRAAGPYEGYPNFSVPPLILAALVDTGYDACSTASNHSNDHGTEGIDRTLEALDAAGLAHAGTARTPEEANTPTLISSPAGTVGLISATYDLNGADTEEQWQAEMIDPARIIEQAAAARAAGAEVIVVALHAGVEYQHEPTGQQEELAGQLLADSNIDLVYGHHAHVVQPLESINGKWVLYGLGNTVAAHGISDLGNREGLLVRVQFSQGNDGRWTTTDVSWVPSLVDDSSPYRWCSLLADSACSDDDEVSLERITSVVNSRGAAEAGAHEFPGW